MLTDKGGKRFNRAIKANVIVGDAKNEVAGRQLQSLRIISRGVQDRR